MLQRQAPHSACKRAGMRVRQEALRCGAARGRRELCGGKRSEREVGDQAEAMVGQRFEQLAYHC